MGKGAQPQAPDPLETAAGQTGTNIATSIANTTMGNVNQFTPYGNLTWSQVGSQDITDPFSGQTYTVPQWQSTQTLSDSQQAIFDDQQRAQRSIAQLGADQSDWLRSYMGNRPDGGVSPDLQMTSSDALPDIQTELGDSGEIASSYGPNDFSSDRLRVEQGLMDRMQPQFDRDRAQLDSRLASQGITQGSEAYNREIDRLSRQQTDARFNAMQAGGAEQSRLTGLAAQRAGFQNASQAQRFGQNQQAGTFRNMAGQQGFQNAMALNAANNDVRAQQFALDAAGRAQPLNEIMALASGSQVQMPNFQMNQPSQMQGVDYTGLVNNNYNQQMNAWNNQQNNAMQGLGLVSKLLTGGKV